jgi:hypothetical protein
MWAGGGEEGAGLPGVRAGGQEEVVIWVELSPEQRW